MSVPVTPQALGKNAGLDVGAVLALVDQCMGTAAAGETTRPCVTLDLRVDWLSAMPPGTEIFCRARRLIVDDRWILVEADIDSGSDTPTLAKAVGQFFAGTYPGGGSVPQETVSETITGDWTSFDNFLALRPHGKGLIMAPSPQAVGTTYLPALHGGMIAAALLSGMVVRAEAETARAIILRGATFDFLRPGRATEPLLIETRWIRSGRNVGRLGAEAFQPGQSEAIATARATVVLASSGVEPLARKA